MLAQLNDCIGGLLHLGPNVITFRALSHLGSNVVTFRTVPTFRTSTYVILRLPPRAGRPARTLTSSL